MDIWFTFDYTKSYRVGDCTFTANFTVSILVSLDERKVKDIRATLTPGSSVVCDGLNNLAGDVSATIIATHNDSEITGFLFLESSDAAWAEVMNSNESEIVHDINRDLEASW